MKKLTYTEWMILEYKNTNSPWGDVAKDIAADGNFPTINTHAVIKGYFEEIRACDAVMDIFECSWKTYVEMQNPIDCSLCHKTIEGGYYNPVIGVRDGIDSAFIYLCPHCMGTLLQRLVNDLDESIAVAWYQSVIGESLVSTS